MSGEKPKRPRGRPRVYASDAARKRAWEEIRQADGIVRIQVLCPASRVAELRAIAERMRYEHEPG
jgi:hypothetical protein